MAYVNQQSAHFRSDNIIETMGGDFTFMDANVYFKNLDKLIRWAGADCCSLPGFVEK